MKNNIKKLHNHQLSSRAKVILVIEEILNGKSLSELLDPLLESTEMSSRGFVHELLLGTLRQWWALSRISESLIENPVTDQGVQAAINIPRKSIKTTAYQIGWLSSSNKIGVSIMMSWVVH